MPGGGTAILGPGGRKPLAKDAIEKMHKCTPLWCMGPLFWPNCPPLDFLIFKLDLEKAEEPEIKSPTSVGS